MEFQDNSWPALRNCWPAGYVSSSPALNTLSSSSSVRTLLPGLLGAFLPSSLRTTEKSTSLSLSLCVCVCIYRYPLLPPSPST
ncbi:hypothetical protein VTI74DRAFT_8459 [Chaetomium olivicolor]